MEKRHRIFIAINLPEEIKKELFAYSEKWGGTSWVLPAKWTNRDNLHITLEFLGDLTDQELGEVCLSVKEVAEANNSFSLNLNKIVYGPPKKLPPKMVWAEGEKSKELASLRQNLEESLEQKVKFAPEGARGSSAFVPHVTLARISSFEWKAIEPEERPEINENLDLVFSVESIEVMESTRSREGQRYTVIESHQLK